MQNVDTSLGFRFTVAAAALCQTAGVTFVASKGEGLRLDNCLCASSSSPSFRQALGVTRCSQTPRSPKGKICAGEETRTRTEESSGGKGLAPLVQDGHRMSERTLACAGATNERSRREEPISRWMAPPQAAAWPRWPPAPPLAECRVHPTRKILPCLECAEDDGWRWAERKASAAEVEQSVYFKRCEITIGILKPPWTLPISRRMRAEGGGRPLPAPPLGPLVA